MPTSATNTFTNSYLQPIADPESAKTLAVSLANSTTLTKGTVVGELTASAGKFAAYASGNSDGTQNPKGIIMYDAISDGSGNITYGTATGGGSFGETFSNVPIYIAGTFDIAALTGLDANAVTKLAGNVITGVVGAPGWFRFG